MLALERDLSLGIEPASWGDTETRGNDMEPKLGRRLGENSKPVSARKHFKTRECGHMFLKIHQEADNPGVGNRIRKCPRLYHQ